MVASHRSEQSVNASGWASTEQPAADDASLWVYEEYIEEPGERFPWLRLGVIGIVVGLLIGLPLVPNHEQAWEKFGEIAGPYGCPFHPQTIDINRGFTVGE